MTPRLTSRMLVDSLGRRVRVAGGHATVLARGNDGAGSILIICAERGRFGALLERTLTPDGGYGWTRCGPSTDSDADELDQYIERRRARDPDLWLIELDIADAERFAAESTRVD